MVGAILGAYFPSFYIVVFVFFSLSVITVRTYYKARDIYNAAVEKKRQVSFEFQDVESAKMDKKLDKSANGIILFYILFIII